MEPVFPHLAGECDVSADGHDVERVRCWLNVKEGTFDVEMPTLLATHCQKNDFLPKIANVRFMTSVGPLIADQIVVAFAQHMGMRPAWSRNDLEVDFILDNAKAKPQWRFVCNEPLKFHAPVEGACITLHPGIEAPMESKLICGAQLRLTKSEVRVLGSNDFSEQKLASLSLSIGARLGYRYRHLDSEFCFYLQKQKTELRPRPLFYCANESGYINYESRTTGIAEVYRAALDYQNSQGDGGKAFRIAMQAFLDANARDLSFLLGALASFHCMEFFVSGATFNKQSVHRSLGLRLNLAEALSDLRNDIVHNNVKPDLHGSIIKCCKSFEESGVDLIAFSDGGGREYGLLSFLRSLAGHLILKKIGANVVPVNFATDRHPFRIEDYR